MELSFLQNELVQALCWTLLHSIWQGVLLALVTGLVLLFTKTSHARKRYSILTTLFFIFIGIAFITFWREINSTHNQPGSEIVTASQADINQVIVTDIQANGGIPQQSFIERFTAYFNANASLVVMIWFVIFFAKFLRLSANLVYVQRLKSYKVHEPAQEWKEKLSMLVQKLGITKKVKLIESGFVKVPLTMGMLKPVILLPMGLLSNLPADEIEAILLHELAHIRRRDYFVNLLQSIAETIFFFNPSLLWLSSVIRDERENCCDDLAISVTNNKTNFINALISFQEYHLAKPGYGMAFPGSRNQLLSRVKRIISNSNKTLNAAEKSVLSLGLAMFALFFFVAAKTVSPLQDKQAEQQTSIADTVLAAPFSGAMQPMTMTERLEPLSVMRDTLPEMREKNKMLTDTVFSNDFFNSRFAVMADKINMADIRKQWSILTPDKWEVPAADKASAAFFRENPFSDAGFGNPDGPFTVTDTLPAYKNFSSDITENDNNRIVKITATTTDGKQVYFKKENGLLKELSINGKKIDEADFEKYKEEVAILEEVDQTRRIVSKIKRDEERIKREHQRDQKRHEWEKKREENRHKLEERRLKMDTTRHRFGKERDKLFEQHKRILFDKQKSKVDKSVALAPKIKSDNLASLKAELSLKDSKLDMLKPIRVASKIDAKGNRLENLKPLDLELKPIKPEGEKEKQPEEKQVPPNKYLKVDSLGNVRWAEPGKASPDVKKPNSRVNHIPGKTKRAALDALLKEDEARRNAAARVMLNIAQDIQNENIAVDLEKSWFALDKEKFVVDGKSMPEEMHNRFRQKYVKGADGSGWYYGPVKLAGRGIFLDKKDLEAR